MACAICSPRITCRCSIIDTGVGGRFSALTNVGLLPAAVLGLDIAAIREGAALALAPVLAKKKAADVPAALGAALAVALAESKGKTHQRADGLCRPARTLHALVRAALGGEPRQERQRHDAGRGARAGRPAQPGAAVHRRPARQAVHRRHRRSARAAGRASTRASPSLPASPISAAKPSVISSPRKAAPPPRLWPKTAARCAPFICRSSTKRALGELLMHFMLETIIAAHLLGVDAFDQPAVEEGKVLAKKYLTEF